VTSFPVSVSVQLQPIVSGIGHQHGISLTLQSRQNLALKRRPWVCSSTPNLALIGKRGSVQESTQKAKFAQNCLFWPRKPTQGTHSGEIWRVGVDHVCTLSCQIWPGSIREHSYKSHPKCKNLRMVLVLQWLSDAYGFQLTNVFCTIFQYFFWSEKFKMN